MKRNALASAAVLVLLSVTACTPGGGTATPSPTPAVTPSATPTPTVTATLAPSPANTGGTTQPKAPPKRTAAPHTPRATPTSPEEISGAIGQVPAGFKLPDEDRPGDDEVSAFTTTTWRAACPDRVLKLATASGISASRIKESIGPEHAVGNGLLVFADDTAADAFMDELVDGLNGCDVQGPNEDGWRTVQVVDDLTRGDAGVQVRQWTEWDSGGTWVEAPGAALEHIVRKGNRVVLSYEGGEFLGDPAGLAELVADVGARIDAMLAQV